MDREVLEMAKCLYDFMSAPTPLPEKADLILVLGSHDLRVPSHAADLYKRGIAPLVICSGGYGKMTEGVFPRPEGVLFAERCAELGVPPCAVLIEDRASNTGENFSLSRQLAGDRRIQRAVAVCKPYMAKRALAAGKVQWPGTQWHVSVPDIPFEGYSPDDAALQGEIELMVGDLQRLRLYAERGFQAPTEVPGRVWEAYLGLVRAGFDRYVIA